MTSRTTQRTNRVLTGVALAAIGVGIVGCAPQDAPAQSAPTAATPTAAAQFERPDPLPLLDFLDGAGFSHDGQADSSTVNVTVPRDLSEADAVNLTWGIAEATTSQAVTIKVEGNEPTSGPDDAGAVNAEPVWPDKVAGRCTTRAYLQAGTGAADPIVTGRFLALALNEAECWTLVTQGDSPTLKMRTAGVDPGEVSEMAKAARDLNADETWNIQVVNEALSVFWGAFTPFPEAQVEVLTALLDDGTAGEGEVIVHADGDDSFGIERPEGSDIDIRGTLANTPGYDPAWGNSGTYNIPDDE